MARVVENALKHATAKGADVQVTALAAVRATRQARAKRGDDALPCITGTPIEGETIEGRTYDGKTPAVIYPGSLPADPAAALASRQNIRFVRFRPPPRSAYYPLAADDELAVGLPDDLAGEVPSGSLAIAGPPLEGTLPHIRLDRALQFLLGDKLQ